MSDSGIRSALETALFSVSEFPNSSNRALENTDFSPTIGTTWARVTHFWGPETQGSLPAAGASIWRLGIMSVVLFRPLDGGAGDTLPQAIKDALAPGTVLSVGGRALTITMSRRWSGVRDEVWWKDPLDVHWKLRALSPLT